MEEDLGGGGGQVKKELGFEAQAYVHNFTHFKQVTYVSYTNILIIHTFAITIFRLAVLISAHL